MQVLVVGDAPGLAEEAAGGEARDGVTPPMRNARERVFRRPIEVAPEPTIARKKSPETRILAPPWSQPTKLVC